MSIDARKINHSIVMFVLLMMFIPVPKGCVDKGHKSWVWHPAM